MSSRPSYAPQARHNDADAIACTARGKNTVNRGAVALGVDAPANFGHGERLGGLSVLEQPLDGALD